MKNNNTIALLGGGGRTGKYIVQELIKKGYQVKLLLRNPEKFQIESPLIKVYKGDALDETAIKSLLENCTAVINTVGQRKDEPLVASQATRLVLESMSKLEIKRYILVAGLNVDTPFDKKSVETKAATEWMKANFPLIHEDRQKTYTLLSQSNVDWTLVRVPFIEFSENKSKIKIDLEDCVGSKINASDIAYFVVEQLSNRTYLRKTPFITN